MKIEICEQAVLSWLQHVKGCQIVQTNWMISPMTPLSSKIPYVDALMRDISEKLNDEIDAKTLAELMLVNTLDEVEEEAESAPVPTECEESADGSLLSGLMECFAVLNKKEMAAIRNIFGKSTAHQFITQCEIDVVGIKLNTEDPTKPASIEKIYLIDSAFHKGTLGYGNAAARVLKKLIRACVVSEIVFGSKVPVEIAFATPKCTPGLDAKIQDLTQILSDLIQSHYSAQYGNIQLELYFNERFADEIYKPLKAHVDLLNNDNDLFMRSLNLAKICEKTMTKTAVGPTKTPKKSAAGKTAKKAAAGKSVSSSAVIDLKQISPTYLQGFPVGKIASQVLGAILKSGNIKKADVDLLKTEAGSKTAFGFQKPALSKTRKDANGYIRYYNEPFLLFGETLYLYSQWSKSHKDRLIQWIVDWIAANGSIL